MKIGKEHIRQLDWQEGRGWARVDTPFGVFQVGTNRGQGGGYDVYFTAHRMSMRTNGPIATASSKKIAKSRAFDHYCEMVLALLDCAEPHHKEQ